MLANIVKNESKVNLAKLRKQGAEDALELLKSNTMIPLQGSYLLMSYKWTEDSPVNSQLCEITKQLNNCNACAIGVLFVSMVNRNNSLTVGEYKQEKSNKEHKVYFDYLERFFDMEQLRLIESAFERNFSFAVNEGFSLSLARRAEDFGYDYPDSRGRLTAILENIIENNGEFIP